MSVSDRHPAPGDPGPNERAGHRLARLTLAATLLVALLGVQRALGVGSFVTRFWSITLPGGPITGWLLPVTHRAVASLILGLVVLLGIRAFHAQARTPAEGIAALRPATEMTR